MATPEEMNVQAELAQAAFDKLMKKSPAATAKDLVAFHKEWYMKAGHKRLGQIYRNFEA